MLPADYLDILINNIMLKYHVLQNTTITHDQDLSVLLQNKFQSEWELD